MPSVKVAEVALRVGPEKLILVHFSERYTVEDWREQLEKVVAPNLRDLH